MRKIYLAFILSCFAASFVHAQFTKGQKVLGGNLGFSINKFENSPYSNNSFYTSNYYAVSINPSVGWLSKPNLLSGIGLSYGYSYQKFMNSYDSSFQKLYNNAIAVNGFSQRFFTLAKNLFFTVNTSVSAGYNFGKQINSPNYNIISKTTGFSVGVSLAPGLSYRLTQRLLFDAYLSNLISVSYAYSQTKYNNYTAAGYLKSTQNSFNLSSSLSNTNLGNVVLGFRWLLKSK